MRLNSPSRLAFSLPFIFALLTECKKPEEKPSEKEEKQDSSPATTHVEPVVRSSSDSPSGKYSLQILTFPGEEACNKQFYQLLIVTYGQPPREPVPCGMQIVERESGKVVFEEFVVEPASRSSSAAQECKGEDLTYLRHGFRKWRSEEELIYSFDPLWHGNPDAGPRSFLFNWKTCQSRDYWDMQPPHYTLCTTNGKSPCNTLRYISYNQRSYIIYWNDRDNTVSIRKTAFGSDNRREYDFYNDHGPKNQKTGEPPLDEDKSELIHTIKEVSFPIDISVDEPSIVIKDGDRIHRFNFETEELSE